MLVLNCYGKINRICISKKIGMYLSNLPDSVENNWKSALKEQLWLSKEAEELVQHNLKINRSSQIFGLYHKVFSRKKIPREFTDTNYEELVDKMICVTFDYAYDDIPLGGMDTNCFDGRICEDDYAEKVINFMNFLAYSRPIHNGGGFPTPVPQWTYSSNHDELDYFINSIYKDNEYNEYHLIKDFSLCQLMLENKCEAELDIKLQRFLPDRLSNDEKQLCAKLLRQLRNKIAHGDFIAFEEKIEEYAIRFLDGKFEFDYSEYSRKNWTIEHVCCLLDDVLKMIFNMMFYDYETLENIKKFRG